MQAVIFDMDGVIFDSEKVICELWIEYAKEVGLKGVDTLIYRCIGITDVATMGLFKEQYGEDFDYRKHKQVISERFHAKYDGGKLPTKPGIRELLGFLKEHGVVTALASSTRKPVVEAELGDAGLLDYFNLVIGGDMVSRSKPDPEIFLLAAGELKKAGLVSDKFDNDKKNYFVIEDSFNGIRAAHAAGMSPIMVPDLLMPDDEIKGLCHRKFDSLFDVKAYFEEIF